MRNDKPDKPTRRTRILYGVHGYGRGHAARAQAILPELMKRYDVCVLAGDDAYDQLADDFPVTRIPVLRYYHSPATHRRSSWLTVTRNIPAFLDLWLEGFVVQMIGRIMEEFQPDLVMSDSEGWTHRAARMLKIPRISFDHYGVMAYCQLPLPGWDRFLCWAESLLYRVLVARPPRSLAVAFYPGQPKPRHRKNVRPIGPILRKAARDRSPTDGDHLLVYFTNASVHFTPAVEQALKALDVPVKVFSRLRTGTEGNVTFCPIANEPFLEALASCRAVFATAGNQLISEAIHFGKPLLLMPEDVLEQRLNADYVANWSIGERIGPKDVSAERVGDFLDRCDEYRTHFAEHRRDGLADALDEIEQAIADFTDRPAG